MIPVGKLGCWSCRKSVIDNTEARTENIDIIIQIKVASKNKIYIAQIKEGKRESFLII